MSEFPTFLHLANRKADPGREFILHTGSPAWLAEVHIFDSEEQIVEFGKQFMEQCELNKAPCLGSRSRKQWNRKHYFFAVVALYGSFEATHAEADRIARITRRMADWYLYNVLKFNP